MEHILKLQPKYFNYMNDGTKRIELRLYDEKRQKINIGDTIIFQKESELEITIRTKVIGLLRYNTFEELIDDFDIKMLADKSMTKQELLNVLGEFYTPEKQKQYGVVGIRIKKV
jgi:ASC-1-like (ASCH) protein